MPKRLDEFMKWYKRKVVDMMCAFIDVLPSMVYAGARIGLHMVRRGIHDEVLRVTSSPYFEDRKFTITKHLPFMWIDYRAGVYYNPSFIILGPGSKVRIMDETMWFIRPWSDVIEWVYRISAYDVNTVIGLINILNLHNYVSPDVSEELRSEVMKMRRCLYLFRPALRVPLTIPKMIRKMARKLFPWISRSDIGMVSGIAPEVLGKGAKLRYELRPELEVLLSKEERYVRCDLSRINKVSYVETSRDLYAELTFSYDLYAGTIRVAPVTIFSNDVITPESLVRFLDVMLATFTYFMVCISNIYKMVA